MIADSYKEIWNFKASDPLAAMAAVDGSYSEEGLQHTGRWSARQVRHALDIGPGDRVLELGCGVGRIGRELAPHCGHWVGVDISDNMIDFAGRRLAHLDNVSLHKLSRTRLDPVGDGEIDKAYSIAVLCHMDKEDLYLYLRELKRVLKAGGLAFLETWNLASEVGWRRWEYEVNTWARSDQSQRKDVARNQFCTPDEMELYLQRAGFRIVMNCHDSQSIQVIAASDMDEAALTREARRLESVRDRVAYSPLYARFFSRIVDVIFGALDPGSFLEEIDRHQGSDEAALYRPFLLAVWGQHANQWGEPPAG